MFWQQSLSTYPGIGPKRTAQLAEMGLQTMGDLLSYLPYKYIDASRKTLIAHLPLHETVTIEAKVEVCKVVRTRFGKSFVSVQISDESGELTLTYFNQPYIAKQLQEGEWYAFTGKVGSYKNRLTLTNPSFESLDTDDQIHTGRIIPVYGQHENLKTAWLRKTLYGLLKMFRSEIVEYLPAEVQEREGLMPRDEAFWQSHFPESMEHARAGRRRLAFDELWTVFAELRRQDRAQRSKPTQTTLNIATVTSHWKKFQKASPFPLTDSQRQSCQKITECLVQGHPTSHIVQGEVGSGKTLVAAFALTAVAAAGDQALYLAPTAVLAKQHFETLQPIAAALGLSVSLWTAAEKHDPKSHIIVGTHALLASQQQFKPGVVVIDEEHRFGVAQRQQYWQQDPQPHLISMTATPIPRTLAHVLFGEQASSFLELIPGKEKNITTRMFLADRLEKHFLWLDEQIAHEQTQAFVIAPLISASDADGMTDLYDATSLFARLKTVLPNRRIALLTGQTPAKEKTAILAKMQAHELDVLVATPVVEVGIDIPRASIMTITSAERFGLAQLHQLRGRVGRAGQVSWCFLIPSPGVPPLPRLKQLETINNGAELAEIDLANRGVGEFLGTRQTGWDTLQIASWLDLDLLRQVKRVQTEIEQSSPT